MSDRLRPGSGASRCDCPFARTAPLHHDQLLRTVSDVTMAVELLELATTWGEIDYTAEVLVPPSHWLEFAARHAWPDAELAERLFAVAVDVARARSAVPRFEVFI